MFVSSKNICVHPPKLYLCMQPQHWLFRQWRQAEADWRWAEASFGLNPPYLKPPKPHFSFNSNLASTYIRPQPTYLKPPKPHFGFNSMLASTFWPQLKFDLNSPPSNHQNLTLALLEWNQISLSMSTI